MSNLKSVKYYEAKRETELEHESKLEQVQQQEEARAELEKIDNAKRDRAIFLGFFSIGLIATLVISRALNVVDVTKLFGS